MNIFIKYFGLVVVATFIMSCNSHPSLQKYYVDSHENIDYIALDIPASVLKLKSNEVSDDVRETLETIKKVNFLGYQLKEDNLSDYEVEKLKVKEILKNPKYQELITVRHGTKSMTVKFLGEDDAIDEVIIFGSDKELGFAVVRILGNKMDPSKMMALANEISVDDDNGSFKQIESFMKNMN